MMKILISRPIPGPAADFLRGHGYDVTVLNPKRTYQDYKDALNGVSGTISMLSDTMDAGLLESLADLRVISNYAVGYNNIDVAAATKAGIIVTNTPDVLTDATADLTLLLILMAMRRIPEAMKYLHEGRFDGWKPDLLLGFDLAGKNLGILGMGRIGCAVARRAEAFGMKVIYHNRSGVKPHLNYPHVSFDSLLKESDVLSIHLPLTADTRYLIGQKELEKMKSGAVLVNTARGPIIDESAFTEALESGKLFYGACDVFENEPSVHPGLLNLPNVILLPHIGSATVETRSKMGMVAARALHEALQKKIPGVAINPEVLGYLK